MIYLYLDGLLSCFLKLILKGAKTSSWDFSSTFRLVKLVNYIDSTSVVLFVRWFFDVCLWFEDGLQ